MNLNLLHLQLKKLNVITVNGISPTYCNQISYILFTLHYHVKQLVIVVVRFSFHPLQSDHIKQVL
jgi:hypothetical protein